jgi:hypothetical protein
MIVNTDNETILTFISKAKIAIREKEVDISHAHITDLYSHGRLQGAIDGLEEALKILDLVLFDRLDHEDDDN